MPQFAEADFSIDCDLRYRPAAFRLGNLDKTLRVVRKKTPAIPAWRRSEIGHVDDNSRREHAL